MTARKCNGCGCIGRDLEPLELGDDKVYCEDCWYSLYHKAYERDSEEE